MSETILHEATGGVAGITPNWPEGPWTKPTSA